MNIDFQPQVLRRSFPASSPRPTGSLCLNTISQLPQKLGSPEGGNVARELDLSALAVHSLARFVDDQRHWLVG